MPTAVAKKRSKAQCGEMGGRPSKMTAELVSLILADIARGVPKTKAYLCNGIGVQTGYDWEHNNPDFAEQMEYAEAMFEANALKNLHLAGMTMIAGDWKSTAQLLKMRRPEYRDKGVEVNVKAEASASNVALSQEDLEDIRRLNREAITGGPN